MIGKLAIQLTTPLLLRKPCKLFASVVRVCQRQLAFLVIIIIIIMKRIHETGRPRSPASATIFQLACKSVAAADVNVRRHFVALFTLVDSEIAAVPVRHFCARNTAGTKQLPKE